LEGRTAVEGTASTGVLDAVGFTGSSSESVSTGGVKGEVLSQGQGASAADTMEVVEQAR